MVITALAVSLGTTVEKTQAGPARMSIRLADVGDVWLEQRRCPVRVTFTSGEAGASSHVVVPRLVLRRTDGAAAAGREEYQALFDLASAQPLTTSGRSSLELTPDKPLAVEVSACDLHWAKRVLGAPSAEKLRDVVPPGQYELSCEVDVFLAERVQRLRSESIVPVSVR
jgi:hypothetical protein